MKASTKKLRERIKQMPECDKNGFICQVVQILYGVAETDNEQLDTEKEWDSQTIEYIAGLVHDTKLHPSQLK